MQLLLLESGKKLLQTAECAALSIVAHGLLVWSAISLTSDGRRLPADEREARVFFLLPPDRVDVRERQFEVIQLGKLGGDPQDGGYLLNPDPGWVKRQIAHGSRGKRKSSGARGQLPFGPSAPYVPDTAFSVLEVDETVERYESSAAPIYPKDLLATGTQGDVEATYVVDTAGQVDTTTVHVMSSDDPRFTASVMTALGGMRFRPAKRSGKTVRQLVQQKFRFRIVPPEQLGRGLSSLRRDAPQSRL
ncbi:MAG: energy transducer TonB [Gemmatimonadales bacterium]